MTTTAALATRLRAMPDDAVVALVAARRLPAAALAGTGPSAITDFFDLAEALRSPDAVDAALERLPAAALDALAGHGGDPSEAVALGLAEPDGTVDDAVAARLAAHPELTERPGPTPPVPDRRASGGPAVPVGSGAPPAGPAGHPVDDPTALAAGAERAFATMTALAELVRRTDAGAVQELAKGGIGSPLARQLADEAGTPQDTVSPYLDLLRTADLVDGSERTWTTTPDGWAWLLAPWAERWTDVVARWWSATSDAVRTVLDAAGDDWGDPVPVGRAEYPGGATWLDDDLLRAVATAAALGLTVAGRVTATGRTLLDGAGDARDRATEDLPTPVPSVYLQHDLTVIAPGPLEPADDAALRSVARLEAPGLAARYRISDDSIRSALRAGGTGPEILATLDRLSATGVPQPVRYLVEQVAARDGSIVVSHGPDGIGTVVRGPADQLDLIGVDAALRQLSWHRADLTALTTRYPARVVQTALDEQRYPAVLATDARADTGDEPPGRRRRVVRDATDAARALVERLRLATERGDAEPEQAWLGRQIDLAVRGKVPIRVVVRMPDGTETPFTIIPTAVAGGRVRGRDTHADVERTLPLSLVVSVDSDA